ncbi:MAG: hypothetical protein ACXABK_01290, partial [Candidatus Heimdallarchaeaceae archaeon]
MYRKYLLGILVIIGLSLALNPQSSIISNSFNIGNNKTQILTPSIKDSGVYQEFLNNEKKASQPNENFHSYEINELKMQSVEQGRNETPNTILQEFMPNLNITSKYQGEEIEGEFSDENVSLTLPSQGQYYVDGNISNLESQYIQNSGAENNQNFYSEGIINAGLSLNRLKDLRSMGGEYVWKFYSNNTETMTYGLYQDDLPLYNNDTIIEYSYLLESNSSIKNVINSSLIFDFVFDTSRIMIIHWHYTNIDPPLIGDNTTSPFIVYRLLKNSSWNDLWS